MQFKQIDLYLQTMTYTIPTTINTLLIANRGEIASRIIRTCQKMGIKSIAVFSDADRHAPYVAEADTAIYIGQSSPAASYLNQDKLIEVALKMKADAIHPGYGFLSENAVFARRCADEGLIFVGPNPEAIESMGSKSKAKILMQNSGVPTVPGYQGEAQDLATLKEAALSIGFPLLLKATSGGGGKGMRIVQTADELLPAIEAAQREALSAFGDSTLLIEKYIERGRHIEFQIFGDKHGNVVHLLERECTIQRRYQKIMEETPSPVMTEALRQEMGTAAVNAAKALHYDNAGTVEFIYDDQSGAFYFLEVNTRLQVEHPITEEITGLDLVQWQIEVAQGGVLPLQQADIKGKGYAIELRLYAEDATHNFRPATGQIALFDFPKIEGLRMETAVSDGSEISVFYDPMIAKIIVFDPYRTAAFRKMRYVLQHLICLGTITNQDFLLHLISQADVVAGQYDTHFIQKNIDLQHLNTNRTAADEALSLIAVTLFDWQKREAKRALLRALPSGWRNNFNDYQQTTYTIDILQKEATVKYRYLPEGDFLFLITDNSLDHATPQSIKVHLPALMGRNNNNSIRIETAEGVHSTFSIYKRNNTFYLHNETVGNLIITEKERFPAPKTEKTVGGFEAQMPSQIVKILVKQGQKVVAGDALIVLSSMKMENTVLADQEGEVAEIYAVEGANVPAGYLLLRLKKD